MPFNSIFSWLIKKRIHQIDLFKKHPLEVQDELLEKLVSTSEKTEFGKKFNFEQINSYNQFKKNVPLQDYNSMKYYIDKVWYCPNNGDLFIKSDDGFTIKTGICASLVINSSSKFFKNAVIER